MHVQYGCACTVLLQAPHLRCKGTVVEEYSRLRLSGSPPEHLRSLSRDGGGGVGEPDDSGIYADDIPAVKGTRPPCVIPLDE